MDVRNISVALLAIVLCLVFNIAYGYSIYPTAGQSTTTTTTTNPDDGGWNTFTAPIQNFWNSIRTIRPSDFLQINVPTELPKPISRLNGWLEGWIRAAMDWIASMVR